MSTDDPCAPRRKTLAAVENAKTLLAEALPYTGHFLSARIRNHLYPAAAVEDAKVEAQQCEFCGPECFGGACHNARAEDNCRYGDLPGEAPTETQDEPKRPEYADNFSEAAAFAGINPSQGIQFWMYMQHLLGNAPAPGGDVPDVEGGEGQLPKDRQVSGRDASHDGDVRGARDRAEEAHRPNPERDGRACGDGSTAAPGGDGVGQTFG